MHVATVVVTVALAVLMVTAAVRKLSHHESVVESYRRAGVPERMLSPLAAVLLAGAAGLLLGLWWAPVGVAAAVGTVGYFVGAIWFHIRAGDARRLPTPAVYLALAVAAVILKIAAF